MAKKSKKKRKTFSIKIGEQYVDPKKYPSRYKIPKAVEGWSSESPPSEEYNEMMSKLSSAARYIAMNLNEGPEVKDSFTKRTLALKSIIYELIFSTFLNGYLRYGMLTELMSDIYMDIGGNMKVLTLLTQLKMRAAQQRKVDEMKKTAGYTQ